MFHSSGKKSTLGTDNSTSSVRSQLMELRPKERGGNRGGRGVRGTMASESGIRESGIRESGIRERHQRIASESSIRESGIRE